MGKGEENNKKQEQHERVMANMKQSFRRAKRRKKMFINERFQTRWTVVVRFLSPAFIFFLCCVVEKNSYSLT